MLSKWLRRAAIGMVSTMLAGGVVPVLCAQGHGGGHSGGHTGGGHVGGGAHHGGHHYSGGGIGVGIGYGGLGYGGLGYGGIGYGGIGYGGMGYGGMGYSGFGMSTLPYGYRYGAPYGYSMPSYRYSAPGYGAPRYSSPSYSSRGYTAPSYSSGVVVQAQSSKVWDGVSDLKPGMVLPDGAIVVSVGPSVPVESSKAQVTGVLPL